MTLDYSIDSTISIDQSDNHRPILQASAKHLSLFPFSNQWSSNREYESTNCVCVCVCVCVGVYACMRVYMCINASMCDREKSRECTEERESERVEDTYASKERNERERKRQVREKGANKREKEEEGSGGGRSSMNGGHWSHPSRTDRLSSFLIRRYVFTIVSYLIGVFIFATIVGQVGNVITNRNANRLEFERLLDGAKTYMRHHKVPGGMKRRVLRWYDYSWSRGRIQGGGDINTALGLLPDKLKTELALHVNLSVLKKVTIFQVSRFPSDSLSPWWINSTFVFVQVDFIRGTNVSAIIRRSKPIEKYQ